MAQWEVQHHPHELLGNGDVSVGGYLTELVEVNT